MTYKEVEQALNTARDLGFEIAAKREAKDELLAIAASITSQLRGDAGTSASKDPHAKMENYAIKVEELTDQIRKLLNRRNRMMEMIELVEDSRCRGVLTEYYINRKSWDEVADALKLEPDAKYVFRLRREAIEEICKKI